MSLFIFFYRVLIFSLQSFWRNIWLSVVTVTILLLTLAIVNILLILHLLGETAVKSVESKIDVSVSFTPETSAGIIASARGYLLGLPQVKTVEYQSAEEVLETFRETHIDRPDVLASLDEVEGNPFGGKLVVRAKEVKDYAFILEALESPEYHAFIAEKDFEDHQVIIRRIQETVERARTAGMTLGGVFVSIALLIVFNTIRVGIYTHRDEIAIMRLVGASNGFVRSPFLLESVFYAFISVLFMGGILFPMLIVIEPVFDAFFQTVPTHLTAYFVSHALIIFSAQFFALAVLCLFSTMFAMRKYLRV
jgi:cell division transport system permease protein